MNSFMQQVHDSAKRNLTFSGEMRQAAMFIAPESLNDQKIDTTLNRKDLLIHYQQAQLEELHLTRSIWILTCLLILSFAVFTYISKKRQRDIQRLKYMEQITRLRMQNIRNQISPHFVLNILNREIISLEESKRNGLYGLAKLIRDSLDMTERSSVSLEKELEFVKTYIRLEESSLEPDFHVEWNIDPQMDLRKVVIPPMIVQIPVENAIKHGLRTLAGKKELGVSIVQESKGVRISICYNCRGCFTGEAGSSEKGMSILHQTVQLLNSKNTEKVVFKVHPNGENEPDGTRVELFIPQNIRFE